MAVANTKSTIVTNHDASPVDLTAAYLFHGRVRSQRGFVEVAAADDDTSVYRLFRVWSGWLIDDILIANDAITAGTVFDLGVYDVSANGGAAVDADFFATNVDLSSASAFRSLLLEATATDLDKVEKRLWELLGLSSDPQKFYDIALTGDTVGTAAGTIAGKLSYLDGT